MLKARDAWFRTLIETESGDAKQILWSHLSPEMQKKLAALHPNMQGGDHPRYNWLENIHYSWWLPFLSEEKSAYLYLSLFSEKTCAKIEKHIPLMPKNFPEWTRGFFENNLKSKLFTEDILPPECLPEDPLNDLLLLSYTHLVELVDLLSLHDFSSEIKTIVSAKSIKKIRSMLSKKQKNFLQEIMSRKAEIAFAPLGLNAWDGNVDKLKTLLHMRGLNRLAKAIAPSHPSLIWHIVHRFDSGRGDIIQKNLKDMHNKNAHVILKIPVTEIAKLLT